MFRYDVEIITNWNFSQKSGKTVSPCVKILNKFLGENSENINFLAKQMMEQLRENDFGKTSHGESDKRNI